jgi:hypothetical protein
MMWEELYLGRLAGIDEIQIALGKALGIAPGTIRVVDDLAEAPLPHDPATRLLVERYVYPGEFPMRLSCNVFDVPAVDALTVVRKVCTALQTTCLIGDDSPDDSVWLRVALDGTVERVLVDDEALERDELRVAQVLDVERARTAA